MNVFIFAIGGTGARVLRSLTFALASGIDNIPDGTNIIPLIIDYDKDNGDKVRTIKNLDNYLAIRQDAYNGVTLEGDERNFFHPRICHLSDVATIAGRPDINVNPSFEFKFGLNDSTVAGTFASNIGYAEMIGQTSLTRDLLSSLYNDEPEDFPSGSHPFTELNLDLGLGFKGNPNIGSIVFDNIRNDVEFRRFLNTFDPAQDRIFIIASIFGGTGSSGFPRIVDAVRYSGIHGFDNATMGACVVMPYFKVNTPAGGAINSNIFNSKEKAALSYYAQPDANGQSLYNKLTSTYFVGDDNPTTLPYSEGSTGQVNDAHVVEFIAALSVLDFICQTPQQIATNRFREFGMESMPEGTEKINFSHFDQATFDNYLQYLVAEAISFKYYKDYVLTGKIPPKTSYYKTLNIAGKRSDVMYAKLKEFIDDFELWLDEMAVQNDGLKPFRHKPRDPNSQEPVSDDLIDYFEGWNGCKSGTFNHNGTTFKDFTAFCDVIFKRIQNAWPNEEQVFLRTLYDASAEVFNLYTPNK